MQWQNERDKLVAVELVAVEYVTVEHVAVDQLAIYAGRTRRRRWWWRRWWPSGAGVVHGQIGGRVQVFIFGADTRSHL